MSQAICGKGRLRACALAILLMTSAAGPSWGQQWGLDVRPANPTCLAGDAPGSGPVALTRVFSDISQGDPVKPFDMHPIPGQPNAFATINRTGYVYRYVAPGGGPVPQPNPKLVIDVSSIVGVNNIANAYECSPDGTSCPGSEHYGLVSFAFHPAFAADANRRWIYLLINGRGASDAYTTSYLIRYTLTADGSAVVPNSSLTILSLPQRTGFLHHIGHIVFGPADGLLYIGAGDGSMNGWDPNITDPLSMSKRPPAQNLSNWFGKILRINVDNSTPAQPYTIPDNPFVSVPGAAPEIYAYGVRNPWRFSFDPPTGQIWLGDVGYATWEEVDRFSRGGNYGWPVFEANACVFPNWVNPETGSTCSTARPATAPLAAINHNGVYMGIIGGYVYRGAAITPLQGKYVFSLYEAVGGGKIYKLDPDNGNQLTVLIDGIPQITSWFTDTAGELYAVASWEGNVYKLTAGSGGGGIPQLLSQTGCVDPTNPKKITGMIPFGVNAALWSDGADKVRAAAIPDGTTIHLLSDGDFDFPNGTVLMKSFLFNGQPFETRFLKKHTDGSWAGYSYQWQGNDAVLVDQQNGLDVMVTNNQGQQIPWHYPSSGQCKACHTQAAGVALGLELGQLNGNFKYSATRTANQVTTWDHIGMFSDPLPSPVPLIVNYGSGSYSLNDRVRSYLHANCSICHRPGNNLPTPMDFRYFTSFAGMNVCNATTAIDNLGIPDAKLLYPGDPYKSLITQRMNRRGAYQMPPLGTQIVHSQAVGGVASWIKQITACP